MAILRREINDKYFIDAAYYLIVMDQGNVELTCTKAGPFEGEAAEKTHKESGSPIPWQGVGTVSHTDFSIARGLRLSTPDVPANPKFDPYLYDWFRTANGTGFFDPAIADTRQKRNFTVFPMNRRGQTIGIKYDIIGAVPKKYKGWEGDASSDDVVEEQLDLKVEDIVMSLTEVEGAPTSDTLL